MNLSISNIAWDIEWNDKIFLLMQKKGFSGLEIAPTKIFPVLPYKQLIEASKWKKKLTKRYGLEISSMQSIWYGRKENIFQSKEERDSLLQYTKQAILFAEHIECRNLVFGCPKNRFLPENTDETIAVSFFYELGEYALQHHTVIGMEANPMIYHTNYINTTKEALNLIKEVNSNGFHLNVDLGTIIENQEELSTLTENAEFINHVHISEPSLRKIRPRKIHSELAYLLNYINYQGYVSIEMEQQENLTDIEDTINYVKEIFG